MSDPIRNDYSSVTALTPAQEHRALLTLVSMDAAANPMDGALNVHDLIDMLGLSDTANELRAQRGLKPSPPSSRVPAGKRDSTGRLRSSTATTAPAIDPIPAGHHGHNGRCASGDHAWTETNIWRSATGKERCGPCEMRTKRGGSSRKAAGAVTLCRCPGRKHELTEHSSASTYVSPDGQRMCRIGIDRRKQAEAFTSDRCRAGLHPKDGPGRCKECKAEGGRARRERDQRREAS